MSLSDAPGPVGQASGVKEGKALPAGKHNWLVFIAGVAISIVCLWLALRGTNFDQVGQTLAQAQLWYGLPLLLCYMLFYWIKAIRWRMMLKPIRRIHTRELFTPMMMGFFANNILPAHLGEFVRMYLGAKMLSLGHTQVLATIILERIFDFLAVVLFLGVALILGGQVSDQLANIGYGVALTGLGLLLITVVFATYTRAFLGVMRKATFFLPDNIQHKILHHLEISAMGFDSIKRPRLLAGIIATSLLQWLLIGACIYCGLLSVGIEAPASAAFVVLAATVFAVTLPAAPGFFGTMQLAFTLSLLPYGIEEGQAFAASVVFHAITYLSVTLLGIYLLRHLGYRLGDLRQQGESAEEEVEALDTATSAPPRDGL
ncbi:MAG: lysylphosphatidylglycerol synthase transmembrane domain-containing protein [Mariprofundaceae bacterium]